MRWETYEEQSTDSLLAIVETTGKQIDILRDREGSEQVLRVAEVAHKRALDALRHRGQAVR